jgi:HlyD family secretion protein
MALMRNKWVWIVIVLILVSVGWAFSRGSDATGLSLGVVERKTLTQRVTIAGSVMPNRKTVFSAPYNGYVRKIYVKVGEKVKEGDPVVTISQTLKDASEEVFPLRAPFAGTVVQVLKSVGEYVEASGATGSTALVRIDDLETLYIEALSPEIEISKLKLGQDAIIRASAILSRTYKGKVSSLALASKGQREWESSKVEFPVTISIADADEQLKPGMSVIVDVIANRRDNVLTLPHEYVEKVEDQYFVTTEKGEKKEIKVGLQNEEAFEILSGVGEGELVRPNDFTTETQAMEM